MALSFCYSALFCRVSLVSNAVFLFLTLLSYSFTAAKRGEFMKNNLVAKIIKIHKLQNPKKKNLKKHETRRYDDDFGTC